MLEINSLCAGYHSCEILHNINLSVPEKKITAIIGPNGCGKTTLLKSLSRLLPFSEGRVLYHGKDISSFGRREFARLVSVLPQMRNVPSLSAEALVAHGRYPHLTFPKSLSRHDEEIIENAMRDTNTLHLRGKYLAELSGGERQRVYIAMTLAQDTEFLFLDEPTTYLDVAQKYEILELISRISAYGKTVVMVLHDLPLAFSFSDNIAVMSLGQIVAFGSSQQVFAEKAADRVFAVSSTSVKIGERSEYLFFSEKIAERSKMS